MANTDRVLVQDLSSKTAFLHVNGKWVHFDNFAPRLGKTTLCALQRLFESLFWTTFFQNLVQIIQQNVLFCQSRSEKPLLLKSRILKILRGFSSFFEDRNRLFESVFDPKLTSPRKGPFCTLAKCFALYHFGDHSGFYALLTRFLNFFFTFSIFFFFSPFLCHRQKCVPRLRKTYNS